MTKLEIENEIEQINKEFGLTCENGVVTTTSLKVAEIYGKDHADVLKKIRKFIELIPELEDLVDTGITTPTTVPAIMRNFPAETETHYNKKKGYWRLCSVSSLFRADKCKRIDKVQIRYRQINNNFVQYKYHTER